MKVVQIGLQTFFLFCGFGKAAAMREAYSSHASVLLSALVSIIILKIVIITIVIIILIIVIITIVIITTVIIILIISPMQKSSSEASRGQR